MNGGSIGMWMGNDSLIKDFRFCSRFEREVSPKATHDRKWHITRNRELNLLNLTIATNCDLTCMHIKVYRISWFLLSYGRNIKGSYKVIESSRPQQKYWHFFMPESYVVEDKQRLWMKFTCFGCFFWTLTQCQMALMHECILFKTLQIYNFKTRLGEICSSDVNAKGYSGFFDITAIEVYTVSCDWQQIEKIATVFFIIIISFGLTRG